MKTAFNLLRTAVVVIAFSLSLTSCVFNVTGFDNIVGNGVTKSERRTVTAFSAISNRIGADVEITCKQSPGLEITGDENILPYITTEISNGVLIISTNRVSINPRRLSIKASTDMLVNAEILGSGNMTVAGVDTPNFVGNIGGSGNMTINGQAPSARYTVSGSGNVEARNTTSQNVVATITGSGNITVNVSQTLEGTISGSGSIIYFGNPGTVRRNITGSGSIVGGR
ncbi:MAG: DUF2807 domain-containing protein [Candidatus Kapabacteria bacterium]|jgi:hypothetical protein|nr:DUF2807 domain-containing protein [Candidatus Kapabacteria bacterium]